RFQHLYPDQHDMLTGLFADIVVYQTVYLFGIGYNKSFAGDMQEISPPFAEKFHPHRKLPVEFVDRLAGTGNKEPYLSYFIYFNYGNDCGGNSQHRTVETEKKGIFQILYFFLQKTQIRLGQHK